MEQDSKDLERMLFALDGDYGIRETYVKGVLNYTGNKYKSLKHILPNMPLRNTWVDVFGGSGIVTLNREPSNLDVFNDRNSGVTAFFKCCQDKELFEQMLDYIRLMPHSRQLFIEFKDYQKEQDDAYRAAKFYYIIQSSFGGRGAYWGRSVKGKGTIWKKIQKSLPEFNRIRDRFLHVQVENLSWEQCLKDYDSPDTVFYLDPPYWESNVYVHKMDKHAHMRMCDMIFELEGFVALSGFDNVLYTQYDWDEEYVWDVDNSFMTALAPHTKGKVDRKGSKRKEHLWIKK